MTRDILTRARDYPYDMPMASYIWTKAGVQPWETVDLLDRAPVLACGSNQSAAQLSRKFGECNLGPVPVMVGWADGLDSVYSAHFSAYGSIPATSLRRAGVRSRQAITWLTPDQLTHMHETEALGVNYTYQIWDGINFQGDEGSAIARCGLYISLHGVYAPNGTPIGVRAIEAQGRSYPALSQHEVQSCFLKEQQRSQSVDELILENVQNQVDRDKNKELLKKTVLPPSA